MMRSWLSRVSGLLLFLQSALIVTGGAVRLTGSGLGCPTWPECTKGSYVPVAHQVEGPLHAWIEFGNRLLTFALVITAVATLIIVIRKARKDLRLLAIGQVLGIFAQGVLGGITVLTKLNPIPVAGHFLLSIALVAGAARIYAHRGAPEIAATPPSGIINSFRKIHLLLTLLVIILGTIVTGSGPHAGDIQARRFGFDPRLVSWIHADTVIALLGLTLALYVATLENKAINGAVKRFGVVALAQGAIGYVQYFTKLPILLVGAHLLGATLVWIYAFRIHLAFTSSTAEISRSEQKG
ncbi:MAG: COX15/CtaA family protein [Actinomycetes bacterium]